MLKFIVLLFIDWGINTSDGIIGREIVEVQNVQNRARQMQSFWGNVMHNIDIINPFDHDFKGDAKFPLRRIRRVMKEEDAIKVVFFLNLNSNFHFVFCRMI